MRTRICILAATLVFLGACSDEPAPMTPESAAPLFSSHQSNPLFAFLPPLSQASRNGTFNPDLAPTVAVCTADNSGACANEHVRWTMTTGQGSERVRLETDHYMVNWHGSAFAAEAGKTYRIEVRLGTTRIGFIDALIYTNQSDANAAAAQGKAAIRQGSTVPVKFHIAQGALAQALGVECSSDCTETAVTPGVETEVVTPSEQGGVLFSTTALQNETEPINVTVSLLDPGLGQCLPTDLQQYPSCFRVTVDRQISLAPNTVVVGVCLDPAILAQDRHNVTIYKVAEDAQGNPVGQVKQLEERPAPFLDCNTQISDAGTGLLRRLARAGLGLLKPSPVYAYDGGIGCDPVWELNNDGFDDAPFSRFGWARPVAMQAAAGTGQSGYINTTLPVNPTVQVHEAHLLPNTVLEAPGVPVKFTFSGPSMTTYSVTVLTDAAGQASQPWTLGSAAGTYTLTVTAPGTNIEGTPVPTVVFTAQAVSPLAQAIGKRIHWWSANNTFADSAGSAHGTPVNGVGFAAGKLGPAFSFDGVDDYISLGTAASLSGSVNFAIEAWVKTSSPAGQNIINQRSAALPGTDGFNGEYILNIGTSHDAGVTAPGLVYFMIYNGGFQYELFSSMNVADGQWHHIVATRHGASGSIYVDGVLVASGSGPARQLDPDIPVYIGADVRDFSYGPGPRKAFNGLMDEISLYGQSLSAAEVIALCQSAGGCQ